VAEDRGGEDVTSSGCATVSVVIPVKDDGRELARCLRALAQQNRRADEIIVVDNASSDASALVARHAGATVVTCDEPGIPAASAMGYDSASGQIILRLDADCVPGGDWVKTMVDAFARRPEIAAFTGGAHFIDGPRWLRAPLISVYLGAYAVVGSTSLGHLPLFGSNLGLRRDAWRSIRSEVHRHDPDVHDDYDLAFHLGEDFAIGLVPAASMGVSMRPFAGLRGFTRRTRRGMRTVLIHWPRDFPPVRWTRLLLRPSPHRLHRDRLEAVR
jgi:glycosyltransferase involved in cell wall biosynthesis